MIILEQSKKQFGTNAFCRSIYNLCEPHITDSVRRHGTTFKKQIVLWRITFFSWLGAARDCHSTGDINSRRRLLGAWGKGCRL